MTWNVSLAWSTESAEIDIQLYIYLLIYCHCTPTHPIISRLAVLISILFYLKKFNNYFLMCIPY